MFTIRTLKEPDTNPIVIYDKVRPTTTPGLDDALQSTGVRHDNNHPGYVGLFPWMDESGDDGVNGHHEAIGFTSHNSPNVPLSFSGLAFDLQTERSEVSSFVGCVKASGFSKWCGCF